MVRSSVGRCFSFLSVFSFYRRLNGVSCVRRICLHSISTKPQVDARRLDNSKWVYDWHRRRCPLFIGNTYSVHSAHTLRHNETALISRDIDKKRSWTTTDSGHPRSFRCAFICYPIHRVHCVLAGVIPFYHRFHYYLFLVARIGLQGMKEEREWCFFRRRFLHFQVGSVNLYTARNVGRPNNNEK